MGGLGAVQGRQQSPCRQVGLADWVLGACLSHNLISPSPLWCFIFPANCPSGVMGTGGGQWCQTEPQVANQLIRFVLNGQNPSGC